MTRDELKTIIASEPYDFLRTDDHLGRHMMFLTIGGSHAYGTNQEGSDVDIRGVTLNSKEDLLGLNNFEHYVDTGTDTTVFSFNKAVKLMCSGNPNVLEQLGNADDLVISYNPATKLLMDNKNLFLSKRVIYSFGGFAGKLMEKAIPLAALVQSGLTTKLGNEEIVKNTKKKLNKTVMNAVRIYLMLFDILEKGELKTYRGDDLDTLMKIRNGNYDYNEVVRSLIPSYEKRLNADRNQTLLPGQIDARKVNELMIAINEEALKI